MTRGKTKSDSLAGSSAFHEDSETLNVIVDTPKGSRNMFKFDEARRTRRAS